MNDKGFIINAGPKGTFKASGNYSTTPADVDQILKSIKEQSPKKITLYFHGGLVSEATGLDTARKLYPKLKTDANYPVFLVWETGLIEILKEKIQDVGQTELFKKLLKLVIKIMEKKLGVSVSGGRGAGNLIDDAIIKAELNKERPFENLDYNEDGSGRGAAALDELPEQDFILEGQLKADFRNEILRDEELLQLLDDPDEDAKGRGFIEIGAVTVSLAKIGIRVVKRFLNKRDHGFFPTIVEEIFRQLYLAEVGALVWNGMKTKAVDVWRNNDSLLDLEQHAGRYFLDGLMTYIAETVEEGKPTVKINLVGHSAGSIVICELMKESAKAYPALKFDQLILMAPACRTDLFIAEVASHPERYNSLRCFTMSDANESKDTLVPYLYTRSLLYLISGVLENKGESFDEYILGMERFLTDQPPYQDDQNLIALRNYFAAADKRLVLSESAEDAEIGFKTSSLKHGDFDDNELTVNSICCILNV